MINDLKNILTDIPYLISNKESDSLLINKHAPIIYRVSLKISEDKSIYLHKLFNTNREKAFMHSHSWNFACKVLQGEYEMGVGFSKDREVVPESVFTSFVKAGDMYEMLSPDIWHYTKPIDNIEFSYSVMLVDKRHRERKAENNEKLSYEDKQELLYWFSNFDFKT